MANSGERTKDFRSTNQFADRPLAIHPGKFASPVPQTRVGRWWEEHPASLRSVTIIALVSGGVYLGYRLVETGRGANPFAFTALCLVELYNFISLMFLAFYGWRWSESVRPPATAGHSVDVFVTTYDESLDVLEATLTGCAALRYPHTTHLLDDGRRSEVAALAIRWGVNYVTRRDNAHAKAGNINNALGCTNGELIFCLDADHVPLPDALDALVGYFDDDNVALVQSPHDFYNQDSVQHYEVGRHEQSLFFEVICPGKDHHNGVFWCGSAALLRRTALVGVGGVSTETIAEDFHTTVKIHRNGWTTRYHDEVLIQGLAPLDLDGYLLQRDRWARGNLAVVRLPESPLSRRAGLGILQRVSYAGNLFAYAAGLSRLVLMALLVLTLGPGIVPARMSLTGLLILWVPWTVLAITSSNALCRGHMRANESSHYVLLTAGIFTRALRCVVLPSRSKFKVTPKSGSDTAGLRALARLRIVIILGAALALAGVWRGLVLVGWIHERALPIGVTTVGLLLAGWEIFRICRTGRAIAMRRQRRKHVRFDCVATAIITDDGGEKAGALVTDAALSGFGITVWKEIPVGEEFRVGFSLPDFDGTDLVVVAKVRVQSTKSNKDGEWRLGTSIVEIDEASRRSVLRFCYVTHPYSRLRGDEASVPDARRKPSRSFAEVFNAATGETRLRTSA